jgi:hypothetical protein
MPCARRELRAASCVRCNSMRRRLFALLVRLASCATVTAAANAREKFARAQAALRGKRFDDAARHLAATAAAKDFNSELGAEQRFMTFANLALVLAHEFSGGRDDEAELALNAALTLKPSSAHMLRELGQLHVRRQAYEAAEPLLLKAMSLQPAESASALQHLRLWQLEATRQVADADGKRDAARRAWTEAVALGRDFPGTSLGTSVRRWNERSAAPPRPKPWSCPAPSPRQWDARSAAPCRELTRSQGESLEQATRLGQAPTDALVPAVILGAAPEFPSAPAFWSALSQCAAGVGAHGAAHSHAEGGGSDSEAAVVVETIVAHPDGSAVQVQPASEWASVPQVASQLEAGEATVVVRGAQEHMLLSDLLAMWGRAPQPIYLANGNMDVYLPCMRSAVNASHALLDPTYGRNSSRALREVNVWVGVGGGTASGQHADVGLHNWHHVVSGTKDVLLFPPTPRDVERESVPQMSGLAGGAGGGAFGVVEVKGRIGDDGRNMRGTDVPTPAGVSARRIHHFSGEVDGNCRGEEGDGAETDETDTDLLLDLAPPRKGRDGQQGACRAGATRCVVRAGETLFIPAGWEHNVLTTAKRADQCRSAGINLWYDGEELPGG